eukprot:5185185-Prorocentrum_lima.AAC.1
MHLVHGGTALTRSFAHVVLPLHVLTVAAMCCMQRILLSGLPPLLLSLGGAVRAGHGPIMAG